MCKCYFYLTNFLFFNLSIYFWLCWVFVSVRGLSLVAASGGHSSSRCVGLSPSWPLLLRSTGSRRAGSAVVAHGPSCSVACGILPDQGSNPCSLHWQADSQPLRHQGSPTNFFKYMIVMIFHLWGFCCFKSISNIYLMTSGIGRLSYWRSQSLLFISHWFGASKREMWKEWVPKLDVKVVRKAKTWSLGWCIRSVS